MSEILGPSRLGRETVQRAILWLPDANDIGTVGATWRLSTEVWFYDTLPMLRSSH
jgi:hypothetical protein